MAYPSFSAGDVLAASDMNAVGWWKITDKTFTASTAENIDSFFSSSYRHYLIIGSFTSNVDGTLFYLLRDGTTTNIGTNVDNVEYYQAWGAGAVTGQFANAQTGSRFGYADATYGCAFQLSIYNPQQASYTFSDYTSTAGDFTVRGNARHTVTTTYEGIRITTATGTPLLTGSVAVYGWKP